jgi:hypothetical protein
MSEQNTGADTLPRRIQTGESGSVPSARGSLEIESKRNGTLVATTLRNIRRQPTPVPSCSACHRTNGSGKVSNE